MSEAEVLKGSTSQSIEARRRMRRDRIDTRRDLRARGIRPTNRSAVYCVELEAIPVPEWACKLAVRGMTLDVEAGVIWVRSRGLASYLRRMDAEANGRAIVTSFEFRQCKNCGRVLLGMEAQEQRRRQERFTGAMDPCDGQCVERQKVRKVGE